MCTEADGQSVEPTGAASQIACLRNPNRGRPQHRRDDLNVLGRWLQMPYEPFNARFASKIASAAWPLTRAVSLSN